MGDAVPDETRTSRLPQETSYIPTLSRPINISLMEPFPLRKTDGPECRVLATVAKQNQLFLGRGPAFSPLPIGACFFFFFLCKIFNTGSREENFTDSAHSYPTSHKFRRLIFSCDAHPIGEHEVQ